MDLKDAFYRIVLEFVYQLQTTTQELDDLLHEITIPNAFLPALEEGDSTCGRGLSLWEVSIPLKRKGKMKDGKFEKMKLGNLNMESLKNKSKEQMKK